MKEIKMASYYVSVDQLHPVEDGVLNLKKNICNTVFKKQCLTVGEANEVLKAKRTEYLETPQGKLQYQVRREQY